MRDKNIRDALRRQIKRAQRQSTVRPDYGETMGNKKGRRAVIPQATHKLGTHAQQNLQLSVLCL